MVPALRLPSRLTSHLHGRKQQGNQERVDDDHDQQLNQRHFLCDPLLPVNVQESVELAADLLERADISVYFTAPNLDHDLLGQ